MSEEHPEVRISYHTVAGMKLLGGSPETLSLCIVQTPPPDFDVIKEDGARENILSILTALLISQSGDPILRQYVKETQPVVVVVPEYALGIGDWQRVDDLIRSYGSPIVLIAGFGASTGEALQKWKAEAKTQTVKHLNTDENVQPRRTYNGGWCWIHRKNLSPASDTECLTFLKNYPEQREERTLINGTGDFLLAVKFDDVLLLPTICADLINTSFGSITARIHEAAASNKMHQVLVTCINYQERPWHDYWQGAIGRLTNVSNPHRERMMIVLANHAMDSWHRESERDVWRSLTGIYSAQENGKQRLANDAGIRVTEHSNFACYVFRRTNPAMLIGSLQWPPYGASCGRYLWADSAVLDIADDSKIVEREVFNIPEVYELHRFLGRHLPNEGVRPEFAEALEYLNACVVCGRCLKVSLLSNTCLTGLVDADTRGSDPDTLHDHDEHLRESLHTLAYLLGNTPMPWQSTEGEVGQLHWTQKKTNVLIWRSNLERCELTNIAERWVGRPGAHPPLLIVADSKQSPKPIAVSPKFSDAELPVSSSKLKPIVVEPDRRTNFALPPKTKTKFTDVHAVRKAWIFPMDEVTNAFVDPTANTEILINEMSDLLLKEPKRT